MMEMDTRPTTDEIEELERFLAPVESQEDADAHSMRRNQRR
jgi:hypothetical protein